MESKEYPLVTVFTLIYNTNPRFVIEAIESVKANNYPNLQHIIIDDCSPDPTPKIEVKKWIKENKYPCEFYEHEINYGVCKTLNHVLELAKGKYFFGCSDDIILKNKITNEVEVFESLNENYAVIYSLSQSVNEFNTVKYPYINPIFEINDLPKDNLYERLFKKNCVSAPSTIIRTDAVKKVGGYDESIPIEDYDMWLNLAKNGYLFYCLPDITTYYRVRSDSMTATLNNWSLIHLKIYSKHKNNSTALKSAKLTLISSYLNNLSGLNEVKDFYYHNFSKKYFVYWLIQLRCPYPFLQLFLKIKSKYAKVRELVLYNYGPF